MSPDDIWKKAFFQGANGNARNLETSSKRFGRVAIQHISRD